MNKAFVREPDQPNDYCPCCDSKGEPVGVVTLRSFLTETQMRAVSASAYFCPAPKCDVVYFDSFERKLLSADIQRPIFPKDVTAPICPCFGMTRDDIELDVQEGVTTRVKEILAKAKLPTARCHQMAANGKPCVVYVQQYYMQCLNRSK